MRTFVAEYLLDRIFDKRFPSIAEKLEAMLEYSSYKDAEESLTDCIRLYRR